MRLGLRRFGASAILIGAAAANLAGPAAVAQAQSRCGLTDGSHVYVEPRSGAERLFVTRIRDGAIAYAFGRPSYVTMLPRAGSGRVVAFGAPEDGGDVAVRLLAPKTCARGASVARLKCKPIGPAAAGLVAVEARRPSGKTLSSAIYERGALLAFRDAGVGWRWVVARDVPIRAPSRPGCYRRDVQM